jgi:NCS1 family nucleobase:cation symporter-1
MICDYFFIRRTKLSIYSLYHREGIYHYAKGINPRAIAALALGVIVALIGLWVPSLHFLYDYSWFVGFFLAGLVYAVLMRLSPVPVTAPVEPAVAEKTA